MTDHAISKLIELIIREGNPNIACRLKTDAASAQLIAFGEIHGQPNALQQAGKELMPVLKDLGFSKMAIECPDLDCLKPLFAAFNSGTGNDLNFATQIAITLNRNAFSSGLHGSPLQWDYFQMLLAARGLGIELMPVDLDYPLVDDTIRDKHLDKRVSELLEAGDSVIYWGGVNHLQKRLRPAIEGGFRTMVELLSRHPKKFKIWSVVGVIDCEQYPKLDPVWAKLKEPRYLNTRSLGQDQGVLAKPRICGPNGADPHHPESKEIPRLYWHWNSLIFLPTPPSTQEGH